MQPHCLLIHNNVLILFTSFYLIVSGSFSERERDSGNTLIRNPVLDGCAATTLVTNWK